MGQVTPLPQTIPELRSAFEAYLTQRSADHLGIFEQMVGINSFTLNVEGVNTLGAYTAQVFTNLGFRPEFIPAKNPIYGNHLVLRRSGTSAQEIAMVSHLDTVFPPEEELRNRFHWRIDGERIYGPGTIDIKGGTIVMYMVLDALRAIVPEVFESISWTLLFNAAEEPPADDFSALSQSMISERALACLVFEAERFIPNSETIGLVTSRKGRAKLTVTTKGRSSHSGAQHAHGANAILQLCEIIPRIEQLTDYSQELTANVGIIAGGETLNRVPSSASAELELRAFSNDVLDRAISQVRALGGLSSVKSPSDGFPCTIEVTLADKEPAWPDNAATNSLFDVFVEAGRLLGLEVRGESRGGLSDGNRLWSLAPTIDGLGPIGANGHCSEQSEDGSKEQEYVLAASMIPKAIFVGFAILKLVKAI